MSLTPDRLTGAADPSLALLSAQLHKGSVTDLVARRLPDVQADERKPSIDRFVHRVPDVAQARHDRLATSLRGLAQRHQARAAAVSSGSASAATAASTASVSSAPATPSSTTAQPASTSTSTASSSTASQSEGTTAAGSGSASSAAAQSTGASSSGGPGSAAGLLRPFGL